MKRALIAAAFGCLAGALLPPGAARAYVRTTTEQGQPMRWADPTIRLQVYLGTPPRKLTREQVLAAVVASAQTWSHGALACTGLELSVSSIEEPNGPAADDRLNRITFRRPVWQREPCDPAKVDDCVVYDPRALAITSVLAVRKTGEIVDGDMELNGVTRVWGDVAADPPTDMSEDVHDLQNTVTHELGHLIGLDHNCTDRATRGTPKDHLGQSVPACNQAPAEIQMATMFNSAGPFDLGKRDLAEDDARAACAIYPFGEGVVDLDEPERGGCSVSRVDAADRTSPAFALLALGALALVGLVRRRRR